MIDKVLSCATLLPSGPPESEIVSEITLLLEAARQGDPEALNRVFSELYRDLQKLARARLRGRDAPTLLDTTSLVHESYLRFLKAGEIRINDRPHFLAYAARVMRSVVVDFARERSAERRGGGGERLPLDTGVAATAPPEVEILRVHEALDSLAQLNDRLVRVVEMRYFAGMSESEVAEALQVNERTVRRDWEKARVLLAAQLK